MARGTARDHGHRQDDSRRIRLRSRSPTPFTRDDGGSPRRSVTFSPGERVRRYSPNSPVAKEKPEQLDKEEDFYEQYTDAEGDATDRDRDGDRSPAWKAPRELKRRLWFQKKKLAKQAKKKGGQGQGGGRGGGRRDGRPPAR
jgi:hypothetical protein